MNEEQKTPTVKDILFMPIGCMLQMPIIPLFVILGTIAFASFFAYNTLNFDPLHLWSRQFPDMITSDNQEKILDDEGNYWKIVYEGVPVSTYTGLVRHASPDNESLVPMLTHDILVTTGEFADHEMVNVQVVNHHFSWQSQITAFPSGQINLIHAVPATEELYDLLRQMKKGDTVTITGKEIYRIDSYTPGGVLEGFWSDSGCNTLLVTSITIENP